MPVVLDFDWLQVTGEDESGFTFELIHPVGPEERPPHKLRGVRRAKERVVKEPRGKPRKLTAAETLARAKLALGLEPLNRDSPPEVPTAEALQAAERAARRAKAIESKALQAAERAARRRAKALQAAERAARAARAIESMKAESAERAARTAKAIESLRTARARLALGLEPIKSGPIVPALDPKPRHTIREALMLTKANVRSMRRASY